ncbi:MAG: hypothetical protein HOF38_00845 [Elusimicrobiaceae bacterium]|jgi:L-asparagine transporter-like permease|nr:hypothetical protein [Elusimicrobiaceae bacterium]MBT3954699.1 hypothetical protein [Elusimicrobiaceae bacterium]MBT4008039.1 hypothetical protein [Elusimicrobiaceae bacterium]MBT4402598.1 hypothetical protein [Elusimicrobiaceae bacterium]MBT4439353.1 hypothetical protein [Elusimicrobiaceae bacterium]
MDAGLLKDIIYFLFQLALFIFIVVYALKYRKKEKSGLVKVSSKIKTNHIVWFFSMLAGIFLLSILYFLSIIPADKQKDKIIVPLVLFILACLFVFRAIKEYKTSKKLQEDETKKKSILPTIIISTLILIAILYIFK